MEEDSNQFSRSFIQSKSQNPERQRYKIGRQKTSKTRKTNKQATVPKQYTKDSETNNKTVRHGEPLT